MNESVSKSDTASSAESPLCSTEISSSMSFSTSSVTEAIGWNKNKACKNEYGVVTYDAAKTVIQKVFCSQEKCTAHETCASISSINGRTTIWKISAAYEIPSGFVFSLTPENCEDYVLGGFYEVRKDTGEIRGYSPVMNPEEFSNALDNRVD